MTKSEEEMAQTDAPRAKNAMLEMITTMADTTWRMFVPILGLLILGVYIDKTHNIFPWATLGGFVIGIAISAVLIRAQFRRSAR